MLRHVLYFLFRDVWVLTILGGIFISKRAFMWSPQGLELSIVWKLWNANDVMISILCSWSWNHPSCRPTTSAGSPYVTYTEGQGFFPGLLFLHHGALEMAISFQKETLPLPGDCWTGLYIYMHNSALVVGAKPSAEKLYSI